MPSPDSHIIENCSKSWEEEFIPGVKNKNNCSGFVKAVAKKLGIPLSATADAMVSSMKLVNTGKESLQGQTLRNWPRPAPL
jgi:hypothetical protein